MNKINKKQMEVILSKLTTKEQELLGLIKKNHSLRIFYMIGDANGNTYEEATINLENPFLHPFINALDKLTVIPNHWGIMLDKEHFEENKKSGSINEFEYDLLLLIENYCDENECIKFLKKYNYKVSKQNIEYLQEFDGLLVSETEYSFLVYEGYELK